MWHNAVGDYVTILAIYKTIYENASKIALSATKVENNLTKVLCLHCVLLMFLSSWRLFKAISAGFTFWRFAVTHQAARTQSSVNSAKHDLNVQSTHNATSEQCSTDFSS